MSKLPVICPLGCLGGCQLRFTTVGFPSTGTTVRSLGGEDGASSIVVFDTTMLQRLSRRPCNKRLRLSLIYTTLIWHENYNKFRLTLGLMLQNLESGRQLHAPTIPRWPLHTKSVWVLLEQSSSKLLKISVVIRNGIKKTSRQFNS